MLLPPLSEFLLQLLQPLDAAGLAAAPFYLGASLTGFNLKRSWATALLGVSPKLAAMPVAVLVASLSPELNSLGTAVAVVAGGNIDKCQRLHPDPALRRGHV